MNCEYRFDVGNISLYGKSLVMFHVIPVNGGMNAPNQSIIVCTHIQKYCGIQRVIPVSGRIVPSNCISQWELRRNSSFLLVDSIAPVCAGTLYIVL